MCDGCDSQVHLSCYGLTEVPEGEWFCQGCVDGIKQGEGRAPDAGMCSLCPVPGGILTRVQPPSRWNTEWGADGTHAHLCCAGNLPEVSGDPVHHVCARRRHDAREELAHGAHVRPVRSPGRSGAVLDEELLPGFPSPVRARRRARAHLPRSRGQPLTGGVLLRRAPAPAFAVRRLKAAGVMAATGSAAALGGRQPGAPNGGISRAASKQSLEDATDNETRLAANAQMKEEGLDVEMRKAAFVLRLWHRFVPFLPQPLDAGKRGSARSQGEVCHQGARQGGRAREGSASPAGSHGRSGRRRGAQRAR